MKKSESKKPMSAMPKTKAGMKAAERRETPAQEAREPKAYQRKEEKMGIEKHGKTGKKR